MRQLLPRLREDVVPYEAYRPDDPHAELVRLNMVASVDGRATDAQGTSAGLGGPGDLLVFRALRAQADGILAGAGTARTEGYGPHRVDSSVAELRAADGRGSPAAMVVVSRSLDLDPAARIFAEAVTPTIVLTCEGAPRDRRGALEEVARVVDAGRERVDLPLGVRVLRERFGLRHLLVEGGPSVNRQLLAAGLIDELCVTMASQLAGGDGPRIVAESGPAADLSLLTLLTDERDLFARYRVRR